MVKQRETPRAGGDGVVDRPLGRRVAPARLVRILLERVARMKAPSPIVATTIMLAITFGRM
jgi:hypothetical protein